MILLELVDLVEAYSYKQRVAAGKHAQTQVKDSLRQQLGSNMKNVKLARVGSNLFDIEADIHKVRQKLEVKSLSNDKPYFAFFDTFVGMGQPARFLDDIVARITHNKYKNFGKAVSQEPDSGFPCEVEKNVPKSGRVPKILKNVTDKGILNHVRYQLLTDLADKDINYLALYNRTTNETRYFHISGDNLLQAPRLPHFRKIYFDTYGAPNVCAMRVVVRIAL